MGLSKYDVQVIDFLEKRMGYVIILTHDPLIYSTLRGAVHKTLSIKRTCYSHYHDVGPALKGIKEQAKTGMPLLLLTERVLAGKPITEFLFTINQLYPDIKTVVLTDETFKENLIYLHEIGVDNVITKPVSMNSLIEKIAFTITPPGKLSQLVQAGKDCLEKGEPDKTLAICDKILELKPGSPAGLMLRGDAFNKLGNRKEAVAAFLEAHKSSNLYIKPLKKLAEIFKDHDDEAYLGYLSKLDKLSPLNSHRKMEIGRVHMTKGEMEQAEEFFDEAIKVAKQEAMTMITNVVAEIAQSVAETSPKMSEKYLAQILEVREGHLTRKDLGTFNQLGIVLRRQGKWRQAIENYKKALTIAKDDEGLYYNMGMAYTEGGDFNSAKWAYENALSINPDFHKASSSISYNLAVVFARTGGKTQARQLLKNVIKIQPDHAKAAKLLGSLESNSA